MLLYRLYYLIGLTSDIQSREPGYFWKQIWMFLTKLQNLHGKDKKSISHWVTNKLFESLAMSFIFLHFIGLSTIILTFVTQVNGSKNKRNEL